jgi:hypothetical protein
VTTRWLLVLSWKAEESPHRALRLATIDSVGLSVGNLCPMKEGTPVSEFTDLPEKPHPPSLRHRPARLAQIARYGLSLADQAARGAAYSAGSAGIAALIIWWQTHH